MTFAFSVKPDLAAARRYLTDVEKRQLPFATALAMTRTAKYTEAVEQRFMRRALDRPKPFTLRSIAVRPARRADWPNLEATVFFREFAGKGIAGGKYLKPQVFGGPRRAKRSEAALRAAGILRPDEFLVPAADFPLDPFGNVPAGIMNRILSQLRAQRDPTANEGKRGRRRRRRASRGGNYFVGGGEGRSPVGSALPRGIYERFGARAIRMVFAFVTQPTYAVRFPFGEIAERTAARRFPVEFRRAMERALRTAKR